jgi:hypothetical protein
MRWLLAVLFLALPLFAQPAAEPANPALLPTTPGPPLPPPVQTGAATPTSPAPPPSWTDWFAGSVDIGYRFMTNVDGSYPEYRSTVNLGEGPRLFGADFTIQDPKKRLFDRIEVRGYNWGDPYDTAHVSATKLGIYDFNFDYRSILYFDDVPSFSNPFAPGGYDQQAFDVLIRNESFSLDLLPRGHFIPYLAYERNSQRGGGIDSFVNGPTNQYPVPLNMRDETNNYRGGLRVEYNRFHITLEQGGTTFADDDQSTASGTNFGDNPTPFLGQTLQLTNLEQVYGIRGHSVYTRGLLTAHAASWIDIYGQFLYSIPKIDVNFNEGATGNLLQLTSLLFYTGEQTIGTGAANQPHTTGTFGAEMHPLRRLRIIQSWMTDRYHDAASPLMTEELLLSGATGQNLVTALNYSQVVNYNQEQTDVFYNLLSNRLVLRGGYRAEWGDATTLASGLNPAGAPLESGALRRNVALAGLNFRLPEKFTLNLDYEAGRSDNIYFRTSLNDYNQGRVRARYQPFTSLSLQANFFVLNNQNPNPTIQDDFQSRGDSVSIAWTPRGGKRFSFLGEYDRSTLRSDILFLDLPFFNSAVSSYRDNAHTVTAAIDWTPASYRGFAPKLTLGGSYFTSSGSMPTHEYQPLLRLSFPITKHVSWFTEWQYYGLGEVFYAYEGFHTHIFNNGLRFTK